MRTIVIDHPGGPDVLVPAERPDPVPGLGEVLIEVAAAGVNRADLLQRQGFYPPPPGAPDTPGLECSGVVAAVGPGVRGWVPGDRVAALLDGGGYADLALAAADQLLPVPSQMDLVEAAALPEAVCTAWSNLVMVAGMRAGDVVLIHGGSGGVGTIAIQLAAATGARVATTAGGPQRVARCIGLGASIGIDYRADDAAQVIAEQTGGHGADIVLDVLGASALQANLRCLATGGRLVVIGMQQGRRAEIDLGLLLTKRASLHGTTLRARPAPEKAAIVSQVAGQVWPLVAAGRISPIVHASLPLEQAGRAHELLDSGEVFGKVLLIP